MTLSRLFALVLSSVSLMFTFGVSSAIAANCGGVTPCNCGDVVMSSYTLTASLNCTAAGAATKGLVIGANGITLDCAKNAISGPGATSTTYGISADGKSAIEVKRCSVNGYNRGLDFNDVANSIVVDGFFSSNGAYGAALRGSGSYGNLFDANQFVSNGDEGVHISGPFDNGTTQPNVFTSTKALLNALEGVYLLRANNVVIDGLIANANGAAGLYVKNSNDLSVSHYNAGGNAVHLFGDSDNGTYKFLTLTGNRVKLQVDTNPADLDSSGDPCNATTNRCIPQNNSFFHLCILGGLAGDTGILLDGVAAGGNDFSSSMVDTPASVKGVRAMNGSSGDSAPSLYVSSAFTTDIQPGSSMTTLTTQTTSKIQCFTGGLNGITHVN